MPVTMSGFPFLGFEDDSGFYDRGTRGFRDTSGPNFNIYDLIGGGYQPGDPRAFFEAYPRQTTRAMFGTPAVPEGWQAGTDPRWAQYPAMIQQMLAADTQRTGKTMLGLGKETMQQLNKQFGGQAPPADESGTRGDTGGASLSDTIRGGVGFPGLPQGQVPAGSVGGLTGPIPAVGDMPPDVFASLIQQGYTPAQISSMAPGFSSGWGNLGVDAGLGMEGEAAGAGAGAAAGSAVPYAAIISNMITTGMSAYQRNKAGMPAGEQAALDALDTTGLTGFVPQLSDLVRQAFEGSPQWQSFPGRVGETLQRSSEGLTHSAQSLAQNQGLGDVVRAIQRYAPNQDTSSPEYQRRISHPDQMLMEYLNSGGDPKIAQQLFPDLAGATGKRHEGNLTADFGQEVSTLREQLPMAITGLTAQQYGDPLQKFSGDLSSSTSPDQLQKALNYMYQNVYQQPLNIGPTRVPGWDIGRIGGRIAGPLETDLNKWDIPYGYKAEAIDTTQADFQRAYNAQVAGGEGGFSEESQRPTPTSYQVTGYPDPIYTDVSRFKDIPQVSQFGQTPDMNQILPDIPGMFDPGVIGAIRTELGSEYGEMVNKTNPFTGRMGLPAPTTASAGGSPQAGPGGSTGGVAGGGKSDRLDNAIADSERFLSE